MELVTGQEVGKPCCYAAEGRKEGGSTFYTTTSPTPVSKSAEFVTDVLPHPVQEIGELSAQWSQLEQSRASITSETCLPMMEVSHSLAGEQKVKAHGDKKLQVSYD